MRRPGPGRLDHAPRRDVVGPTDFAAQVPALAKAFHLYLPDARGHATTRWDAADGFAIDDLADDIAAFVDALGLSTFHLLGFSMGAMTALHFGVLSPERLRTLVVAGITSREPRASVARRLMDPVRIDRDDPAWGAELAARHDAEAGARLATAAAGDRRRRGVTTAADAARSAADRRPGAGRRR